MGLLDFLLGKQKHHATPDLTHIAAAFGEKLKDS